MAKVRLYPFSIQTDFSFSSIQTLCVCRVIVKTLRLGYTRFQFRLIFMFSSIQTLCVCRVIVKTLRLGYTRFQFRLTFHFHQYKHYVFVGLFYHEAITFACKDAIAKPSKRRTRVARRRIRSDLLNFYIAIFCVYSTMKQKCLLARAFLQSRQNAGRV